MYDNANIRKVYNDTVNFLDQQPASLTEKMAAMELVMRELEDRAS